MRRLSVLALSSVLALAPLAQGWAAERPAKPSETHATPDEPGKADVADVEKGHEGEVAQASARERQVTTHHSVTIDGKTIPYEATAGTLTLRDDQGKPIASMFYVAYTADHGK